jgi:hypothetical protein
MSSEHQREGYRNRLQEDEIVYFVAGDNVIAAKDGPQAVRKGTVNSVSYGEYRRRYPYVALWETVDEDPVARGAYTCISLSPRELFTSEEVERVRRKDQGPLGMDERAIDEIVADPVTNQELMIALGAAMLDRMAEDELRRPRDPEY